ncbi:diguanylate cyclase [Amphritea opalescens]|uniref:Diguanylate cyclase n=2 Tax=Amphritea opalescens TaxID=2490544 RepID=A0A430KV67_9GAMM|nr:diguanylate cyclase [Amphritea opalescens]
MGAGIDLVGAGLFASISGFVVYLVDRLRHTQQALKQSEQALQASTQREAFTRSILNAMPSMIGYWDRDLRCREANDAYMEWFGRPPEKIIGLTFKELTGEQLFTLNEPYIQGVLAGEPQRFERTLSKANGNDGHIIGHYIPDFDVDGTVKGFSILASEVTVLKETAEALKLAACVFDNTLDGVLITDTHGVILSVNPAFTEITGYTAEEAAGQTPRMLQSSQYDQAFYAAMWQEITRNSRWSGEIWSRRKDGDLYLERLTISMVRDVDGKPVRYISVFNDITALRRKDEHIKHLAFHDGLTDLPNRTLLMDRISQKLVSVQREECHVALMFLDLDGFKPVNDRFGHNVGDYLLKEVAKRLLALVRESDTVARVGGDEFIFILNNPEGRDEINEIAHRVISSINEPIDVCGEVLHIGASVGISQYPADGHTSTELIKNADTAMYEAKRRGRNNVRFFSSDGDSR